MNPKDNLKQGYGRRSTEADMELESERNISFLKPIHFCIYFLYSIIQPKQTKTEAKRKISKRMRSGRSVKLNITKLCKIGIYRKVFTRFKTWRFVVTVI